MKVLFISIDDQILVDDSLVQNRIKGYGKTGDELHFLVFSKRKINRKVINSRIVIYGTGGSKYSYLFRGLLQGYQIAKKEKIDLVSTYDAFESALIAYVFKKILGIGMNVQLHGDFFSNPFWRRESVLNRFRYYLGLWLLKKTDTIRIVSSRIKNDLVQRGFNEAKIVNFPVRVEWRSLAAQQPKFNLKQKYPQFDFIVLFAGRLEKVKGIDLLIRSFNLFLKKYPQSGLLIVGRGKEEKKLMRLVIDLGLQASIVFEPWVDEIVSYYRGADCFVLTSENEGWARTPIEALACGCPVVMTDVGCAGEVIINNENGLVVPVNDEGAIVKALEKIRNNSELRSTFRQNAQSALERLLDEDATLELYRESWEKAIKKRGSKMVWPSS